MFRWTFYLVVAAFLFVTNAVAQPSFQFCGFTYDEDKGNLGLFDQLKGLEQCQPGKGAIWRVSYDPNLSDPSHLAALFCDFSQQILINEFRDNHTVTCVVRDKPRFNY